MPLVETSGDCRFGVLGPLSFTRNGHPVPLPQGHQRRLLALLLMSGSQPLSRDRLIDELWGDTRPPSAVSALHVHLSKLRELLGGLLERDGAGYRLKPEAFTLDATEFECLVAAARADEGRAGPLLREALALFRGAPLADVAWEGSLAGWQRSLEEQRLQATLARVEIDLAQGRGGELIPELEALVEEHPFEERAWGQLMRALHGSGRQVDALSAFQRMRVMLSAELGLDPSRPLVELHERILAGGPVPSPLPPARRRTDRPAAPLPPATVPASGGQSATSSLPRPLTRLVGREEDLAALRGLFADPDVRLVTLTGPGGVGKTRLLLELARRIEPEYRHGSLFARLERLSDPALVWTEVAGALARRDRVDSLGPERLEGYLRDRELLLALDNFEHLLTAAPAMARLLEEAPVTRMLVSSRTPLQVRGEQVYEVAPLGVPADDSEASIAASPSVQLFLQSALAADRRLRIDHALSRRVAEICRGLDGLPLAIELTASRFGSLGPTAVAEELRRMLLRGGGALRDLPDRQKTLDATMRWSYDALSPGAREVLRATSAFIGGFDVRALAGVAGRPAERELRELVDASLVRGPSETGRFTLLELVRTFAAGEAESVGTVRELRDRHMRYFAGAIKAASDRLDAGEPPATIAGPWVGDHANLRSALDHAIRVADSRAAVALALGLRPIWYAGMLSEEAHAFVERVLALAPDPEDEIKLLQAAVFVSFAQAGLRWVRRLVARTEELGDHDSGAMAICNYYAHATNSRDAAEMAAVRPTLDRLLDSDLGDRARGWVRYFLAIDDYVHARFDASARCAAHSAACAEACGHAFMLGCATGMTLMASSARDQVIVQPDLLRGAKLMRTPGVPPLTAFALWLLARYAVAFEPERAVGYLVHAGRALDSIDVQIWPESSLRDEVLDLLGPVELGSTAQVPRADANRVLDDALEWLATRDPGEQAPRANVRALLGVVA